MIGDGEDLAMTKVLDKQANLLAAKIADGASSATSGEGRQPHMVSCSISLSSCQMRSSLMGLEVI
jgi:hypothetical protein